MYADPTVKKHHPTPSRRPRYRRRKGIYIPKSLLLLIPAVLLLLLAGRHPYREVAALEDVSTSQKITFFFDREAPVISGVRNLYTYTGDPVDYLETVSVSDNLDKSPELSVNTEALELSIPGTYELIYTAKDVSGNKATVTASLIVLQKQEGYVDTATVYAAVDQVLSQILLSNMTQYEQVVAIYQWTRGYLTYSDSDDHTDWHQAGYRMLTTSTGDCYGYFAVTKLMLERLGIPNMDVKKVKNHDADSDHFWSLVSVDSGNTYYHLDTTPRIGEGDNFLLVSDRYLDAYSSSHGNCHNRDVSLYPATPEENYGA